MLRITENRIIHMKKIILLLGICLCLWACKTSQNSQSAVVQTHMDFEKIKENTVNKYWKLISIDGVEVKYDEGQLRESSLLLRNDSSFSAFAKCNSFQGKYILSHGNRILFKDVVSTLRPCKYAAEEYKITRLFDEVNSFSVKNDTLYFLKDKSVRLATFKNIVFE